MAYLKIFLTGGSGKLGSALCRSLSKNHQVIAAYHNQSLETEIPEAEWLKIDITRKINEKKVFDADAIIHLAACARSPAPKQEYYKVNELGTKNIAEAAKKSQTGQFIHISTTAVYGRPAYSPMDEHHPTKPMSEYGKSKLRAEQAVKRILPNDANLCIIRPCAVFHSSFGDFNNVIKFATKSGIMPDIGLDPELNFLSLDDFVIAIERALKCRPEGTYNLAGETHRLSQLISIIETALDKRFMRIPVPMQALHTALYAGEFISKIKGGNWFSRDYLLEIQNSARISCEKARREMRFSPQPDKLRKSILSAAKQF